MSINMVNKKHGSSKGPRVISLCCKLVKCVKFLEIDDAKKESSTTRKNMQASLYY